MAPRFDTKSILALSRPPAEGKRDWFGQAEDGVAFLKRNVASDDIIVYVSLPCIYAQTVLAPLAMLDPANFQDLRADYVDISSSWSITESWGMGEHSVSIEPPLGRSSSATLAASEKLIFWRPFDGMKRDTKVELSQKLVHCLGLHFLEEHNAFCCLDERGDIREVIRIIEVPPEHEESGGVIVTIKAKEFREYMAVARMGIVMLFDFTRCPRDSFIGWQNEIREGREFQDLNYDVGVMSGHASLAFGRLVARPTRTVDEIKAERARAWDPQARQYAAFKILDWKNDQQIETSCSPDSIVSYFERDSPLPWHISPAFFRPEVLHRFKADRDKYTLTDRSISCRGAWNLKTYDINEAGQVHTYIRYLADLPYEEQVYWQSFNEWPKASISARAMETDIEGTWSTQYDPLASLKRKIARLDAAPSAWWRSREEALHAAAHAPTTTSPEEWANEIGALDQLLVEGFVANALKAEAQRLGQTIDPQWASLKLMESCLVGCGRTADQAKAVMSPLVELHALRNPLRGHGAVSKAQQLGRLAIGNHGSFRAHYLDLAARCDTSLGQIMVSFGIATAEE